MRQNRVPLSLNYCSHINHRTMSTKKKQSSGILPKMEVLIILVFFFSFIIWAASKCNASSIQEQLTEITSDSEEAIDPETGEQQAAPSTDPYGTPLPPAPQSTTPANAANPTTNTPSSSTSGTAALNITDPSSASSKLYVTIDGLNMRTGPHLDSTIIYKLPLFEEVMFLNEVTDSTQKISLGTEIADEPWVRIKHKKGRTGWVYGAGVNYYRKARVMN